MTASINPSKLSAADVDRSASTKGRPHLANAMARSENRGILKLRLLSISSRGMGMPMDFSAFWAAVLGAIGTWVAGLLIAWITGFWPLLMNKIRSRAPLIIAILALGVSVGAAISAYTLATRPTAPPASVIAGLWNGGGLENLTPGSKLTSSIANSAVRISFAGHGFKTPPVVIASPGHGWHVYIRTVQPDYVDVITQTIDDGRANGSVVTNLRFWFQIIPTS